MKNQYRKMMCAFLAGVCAATAGLTPLPVRAEEDHVLTMTESTGGSASIYTVDTSKADDMTDDEGVYQGHDIYIKSEEYAEGTTVHIRAIPESGYYFAGWTVEGGGEIGDASAASTTCRMSGEDVTVTANFESYASRDKKTSSFLEMNGVMWFYNTYFGHKYADITADLDNLKNNGINILAFFSPYDGDPDLYDGCDPLDWYDVPKQCGTMEDFETLVDEAHARDMKVICYFVNIYIDKNSKYFKTAEEQYAAGEYDAKECATFYWMPGEKENPPAETALPTSKESVFGTTSPAPFLQPYKTRWEWSETAGAWYCNVWLGGGLNFDMPGAHEASMEVEKFWLDKGLDGFVFDVANTKPKMQDLWVHIPESYTSNDKWIAAEINDSSRAKEYADFGFNCWFNFADSDIANDYTRVVGNVLGADGEEVSFEELEIEQIDADGLEAAFGNSDLAHSMNCWTYAWSPWGDDAEENLNPSAYPSYKDDEVMRVQEAALLAGGGITYGCGMYDQYMTWSDTLKANWGKVLKTVNDNAALLPSAGRTRLEAEGDRNLTVYAMARTAKDGSQTALLVYNLSDEEQTVTVDLKGSGMQSGDALYDLYHEEAVRELSGDSYMVTLPAYGFQMLRVGEESDADAEEFFDTDVVEHPDMNAGETDRTAEAEAGQNRTVPALAVVVIVICGAAIVYGKKKQPDKKERNS